MISAERSGELGELEEGTVMRQRKISLMPLWLMVGLLLAPMLSGCATTSAMDASSGKAKNVILFIDELHTVVGAGAAQVGAAQVGAAQVGAAQPQPLLQLLQQRFRWWHFCRQQLLQLLSQPQLFRWPQPQLS